MLLCGYHNLVVNSVEERPDLKWARGRQHKVKLMLMAAFYLCRAAPHGGQVPMSSIEASTSTAPGGPGSEQTRCRKPQPQWQKRKKKKTKHFEGSSSIEVKTCGIFLGPLWLLRCNVIPWQWFLDAILCT